MKRLVALSTLLIVLTACGGGGRPSTDQIADALRDEDNPASAMSTGASDEAIDCIAEALHDSDLSDDALQALVDGDEDFDADSDDREAVEAVIDDIAKCVTG